MAAYSICPVAWNTHIGNVPRKTSGILPICDAAACGTQYRRNPLKTPFLGTYSLYWVVPLRTHLLLSTGYGGPLALHYLQPALTRLFSHPGRNTSIPQNGVPSRSRACSTTLQPGSRSGGLELCSWGLARQMHRHRGSHRRSLCGHVVLHVVELEVVGGDGGNELDGLRLRGPVGRNCMSPTTGWGEGGTRHNIRRARLGVRLFRGLCRWDDIPVANALLVNGSGR